MSNLQIIVELTNMVQEAAEIIRRQAELLEMHGIQTETGQLERQYAAFLEKVENSV